MRNEIDGWDVVREDEGVAVSNHSTREQAIAAAEIRSEEERINDVGDTPVEVDTKHVHEIDDNRQGMKPAFLGGGTLLLVVTLLIVVVAVIAFATGFGS